MSEWLELARRCEQATGADRALEKDIARALGQAPSEIVTSGYGWREDDSGWWLATGEDARVLPKRINPSRVSSSIDAITALIGRELPGALYGSDVFDGRAGAVIDGQTRGDMNEHTGSAATEALARCAAFCRAMAERKDR
jgi:hypothetical protein